MPIRYRRYSRRHASFSKADSACRWTLISHALSIVLEVAPPNATLLTALLDATLARQLAGPARAVLRALLELALAPARGQPGPLVTHPAHANYLRELSNTWTAAQMQRTTRSSRAPSTQPGSSTLASTSTASLSPQPPAYAPTPALFSLRALLTELADVLVDCTPRPAGAAV